MQIRRELNLLQKLYGLYNDVIDTVNGYYDILWVDVNIEKINIELQDFQTRWGRSLSAQQKVLRTIANGVFETLTISILHLFTSKESHAVVDLTWIVQ